VGAGAFGEQIQRLLLDAVLHLAPLAVTIFVERGCGNALGRQAGDHEPGVGPFRQVLGLADHPSLFRPALLRAIGEVSEHTSRLLCLVRRRRNQKHPPQPQGPQAWITMLWHMGLRLPWTWRLGPSNSSERDHVKQMLAQEHFPENRLFCGDAGFTGYPLWEAMTSTPGRHFLVRVGANVSLLSEQADVKQCGGGRVLCWPKGRVDSGDPPLRLRLVRVQVGKTKMWMLTSVLSERRLSKKDIAKVYKNRWGIEVEYRGLKQTIDKHKLRCHNSERLLVELDWSIRAMAVAELIALREQFRTAAERGSREDHDPQDRSLANTMRALRKCMRQLHKFPARDENLLQALSAALVQRYHNGTDKRARYRPKNPDKKPLGDPTIRKLNAAQRERLKQHDQNTAA
jgi:hypothetical protein